MIREDLSYLNTAPAIEGGVKENDPAIVMVPPDEPDSYIVGQFPQIIVPEGSNLVTQIWLSRRLHQMQCPLPDHLFIDWWSRTGTCQPCSWFW